jgi:CheY-like chemotaxis protein
MTPMSLRVVVVDDDARFRELACRALITEGVDIVAQAEDGESALAAVARWQPDVVLLDIGLSGMDGLEVARRLRAEDSGAVVILISTREVAHGRRVAAGVAAGYLPKHELSLTAILDLARPAP